MIFEMIQSRVVARAHPVGDDNKATIQPHGRAAPASLPARQPASILDPNSRTPELSLKVTDNLQ